MGNFRGSCDWVVGQWALRGRCIPSGLGQMRAWRRIVLRCMHGYEAGPPWMDKCVAALHHAEIDGCLHLCALLPGGSQ